MSRKLTHQELAKRQENIRQEPRLRFCVILNNIRSLYNVGSIFRTADGVGVEKLWMCGITGIPPDTQISKTALGAEKTVPWEYVRDARICIQNLKAAGYQIVFLEQTQRSVPYQKFTPKAPVCLVLGNEVGGVDDGLLELCDQAVEIEMTGLKISLNVTVAFGVTAYHFRQSLKRQSSALSYH